MKKTNSNIKLKKFYGDKTKGIPGASSPQFCPKNRDSGINPGINVP